MKSIVIGLAIFVASAEHVSAIEDMEIGKTNPPIPPNCREVSAGLIGAEYSFGYKRLLCASTEPGGSNHVFWLQQFVDRQKTSWSVVDILTIPIKPDGPRLLDPTEDNCKYSEKLGSVVAVGMWKESDRGRTVTNISKAWQMPFFADDAMRFVPLAPSKVTCIPYQYHE